MVWGRKGPLLDESIIFAIIFRKAPVKHALLINITKNIDMDFGWLLLICWLTFIFPVLSFSMHCLFRSIVVRYRYISNLCAWI